MKVLRLFFLLLLAASCSVLISGSVAANDHPWDDSSVDSTHTTGYTNVQERTQPNEIKEPVIVRIKNFFLRHLRSFYFWEVKSGGHEDSDSEKKRGKVKVNHTFINVKSKVM